MALTSAQTQFLQSAVGPAQASQASFGVPASVIIAQAILESGWGTQHIGNANNYFGIKAVKRADGTVDFGSIATGSVQVPTREVINGQSVMVNALFRSYASMTDSFRDHGQFLKTNSRFASAFQTTDADEFARRIAAAGYATDPNYATVVISLMKGNNLYQYNTAPSTSTGSGGSTGGTTNSTPVGSGGSSTGTGANTGTTSGGGGAAAGSSNGSGSSSDGSSRDAGGSADDSGSSSDDTSSDTSTDSSTSDSSTDGGTTDDSGTTASGSSDDSSTDTGSTDSGSTDNSGSTDSSSTDSGSTDDSSAASGTSDDSGTDSGSADDSGGGGGSTDDSGGGGSDNSGGSTDSGNSPS